MDPSSLYDDHARERLVPEPPKRVDAPERTPFERDRARVVHAAASRRLAAKTQVVGPQSDDFVRNRLTHSLEVAQVARDLSRALGSLPDIAETAALAHDLGHPPFGHNGERVLAELSGDCGGFEGNAQTLRLLTRLEAKSVDADGRSVGLNLTRATLDACTKYPWARPEAELPSGVHADGSPREVHKFGVYPDDLVVFDWLRDRVPGGGTRRCLEAQVMDLADDVAYSVHDVEDGTVAGRVDLTRLDTAAVWATVRAWYVPEADDDLLDEVLAGLRTIGSWPVTSYDASRRSLAALKNLTSDLIGRFCGDVQAATFAAADGPFVRYRADLVVPERTRLEIAVLKGVAAHYVMQAEDRIAVMVRQRELMAELVSLLVERGPDGLDRAFADDWHEAADDAGRLRVVVDQVASLTDASAVARWEHLRGSGAATGPG
ncbi:Deoxyguanosinetriphosphate triphosphohydrolase [Nocardioides dokdonensis FR1436]|uniref:Deoxyguanosinetriphosphate triphosphohydrolase-like protein n=1 Tax=Nocardioides dokdonensis FR1436 TaxID=1300347 RepID=A0A1A9GPZ4_9ACTN|nr:deoxyguanosinetriphosphate triphosphohydrolase [Nocardioides dokdonensis]ANH40146.1 Deoxyguanosinetriphosphate triphosphohydrolase [Nocardioides dokdonensis FR1436]